MKIRTIFDSNLTVLERHTLIGMRMSSMSMVTLV